MARSSVAYQPVLARDADRQVIRIMDELYLKDPSLGSRPLVTLLERDHGILINRMRGAGCGRRWCGIWRRRWGWRRRTGSRCHRGWNG